MNFRPDCNLLNSFVTDLEDFAFCDYYDETFDPDGYDYQNAVEACAEDFLAEVGSIFVM